MIKERVLDLANMISKTKRGAKDEFKPEHNVLPTSVLMSVSETYLNIAEKITGDKIILSDNPKAEIIEILRNDYNLID